MKYWIAFFSCLLLHDALSQVHIVDSLEAELKVHQEKDTIHVNILNALSSQYQWLDFNTSLRYAEEALKAAEPIEFQHGIATACFRQAHCYWALGDSERAIEKALRAVSIAEKGNLINVLAETYRILAISYRDQQELAKAVSYIRQAETIATQQKNWDLLARVYNLAGVIDYTRVIAPVEWVEDPVEEPSQTVEITPVEVSEIVPDDDVEVPSSRFFPRRTYRCSIGDSRRSSLFWLMAALLLVATLAGGLALRNSAAISDQSRRLRLEIMTPSTVDPTSLAISPDGLKVVYVAISEGRSQLRLRSLDSGTSAPFRERTALCFPFGLQTTDRLVSSRMDR